MNGHGKQHPPSGYVVVPSVPFLWVDPTGLVWREKGPVASRKSTKGYLRISFYVDGIRRSRSVHSLVAEAFIGPRPCGMVINHIDGDKANNSTENLEYVTPAQNDKHSIMLRLRPMGELHHCAKMTWESVAEARKLHASGVACRVLARKFGVSQPTMQDLLRGKTWKTAKSKTAALREWEEARRG